MRKVKGANVEKVIIKRKTFHYVLSLIIADAARDERTAVNQREKGLVEEAESWQRNADNHYALVDDLLVFYGRTDGDVAVIPVDVKGE